MISTRVSHPSDVVNRGDPVKVKVISLEGSRIGLSMKEVDQHSGRDLANPDYSQSSLMRNPDKVSLTGVEFSDTKPGSKKKRYVILQLIFTDLLLQNDSKSNN